MGINEKNYFVLAILGRPEPEEIGELCRWCCFSPRSTTSAVDVQSTIVELADDLFPDRPR